MEDFITLKSKADLPGFISTDHTGSRGLQGYDDDTFDSINRKAFEALKNSKIIDFYNETEADQIEEALGQTLRGAEGDLTLQDALKGNARNFFTTLDLENPNVMRAIGQYGFAQAISAGGLVKPLKALLFTEKDGNKRVLTGDAKNWKTRQMLEGLKDAQNTYYRDAAERMLNAEYYSDMKGLIGNKIELTENENDAFGKEFANWSQGNMPEIPVDEKSDLRGNVYYKMPKPGKKYIIGIDSLSNEDVGVVLDVIRELSINKWKTLMRKAVNGLIKLDGLKPQVRGITDEELKEILGGAANIEAELTRELNDLVDEVDETGMPKQMLAGRRGTRERVTPGDLSGDKPDFERDFRADEPDKFDEQGRLIKPPVKGSDYNPDNPRVERDIQIIETVDKDDIINALTPIATLDKFINNSTIDVRVNKKNKVYTVTTEEEDWNLYEDFLGVTGADRAVAKISSPGNFGGKIDLNTGRHIEEVEEGFSVEVIREMLKPSGVNEKLFVSVRDSINSILDDKDVILRYYNLVSTEDDINNNEIEDTISDLENYIGELSEDELLNLLKTYNSEESETLNGLLRPFNTLMKNINNTFTDHTENIREANEEQIRSDKEVDEGGEQIEVKPETQEDRTDIQTNTAIKTFRNFLDAYEKTFKKLNNYRPSEDSMEDLQNAMDEFLATPAGLPFKETYVNVLDGEELNEMNRPAVLQRLEEYYSLGESKLEEGKEELVESYIKDDIMQKYKLVDIFTTIITNEETNPKRWSQMAKYTSAGKIQFRFIITVSDSGDLTHRAEIIYNQEFQIKPVLADTSRIQFTNTKQQAAASIDRRGGQKSMTALGREIKENGFGIDRKRKEFIDKIVERLQQLEMVI
jgi:hypothetical protein